MLSERDSNGGSFGVYEAPTVCPTYSRPLENAKVKKAEEVFSQSGRKDRGDSSPSYHALF